MQAYFLVLFVIFGSTVNGSPVLVREVALPIGHEITHDVVDVPLEPVPNVVRIQRSPEPILDVLGLHTKSHHHHHHYPHHGHGGYGHQGGYGNQGYYSGGGGGGFSGSSAQAGSFAGNLNNGYGGGGISQSQASSNAASFQAGPFSASFAASQANSGSNSLGGFGGFFRRK